MRIGAFNAGLGARQPAGLLAEAEHGAFVRAPCIARGLRPGELARARQSAGRTRLPQVPVSNHPLHRGGNAVRILGVDEEPCVVHHFGKRAAIGHDHGDPRGHRFQSGYAEALVEGGQHEGLRMLIQRLTLVRRDVAAIVDVSRERPLVHPVECPGAVLAAPPRNHQLWGVRHAGEQPAVGLQQSAHILSRLERADKQDVAAGIDRGRRCGPLWRAVHAH